MNDDLKKKANWAKKTTLGVFSILLTLIFCWFAFGGGRLFLEYVLYKYYSVEPQGDSTHRTAMTQEQIDSLKNNQLSQDSEHD